MADDGFDFHPPERREAKRFEPPPWEREAFEELELKRADRQAAEDAAEPESEPRAEAKPIEAEQPAAVEQTLGPRTEEEPPDAGPRLDEKEVAEMLAGLSAEEPGEYRSLWRIAMASAIVLGAIGAVLIVWAIAAMIGARETGAVGLTGGFVLLFFGAGFVAGAWWLTVRTLRQRGVL